MRDLPHPPSGFHRSRARSAAQAGRRRIHGAGPPLRWAAGAAGAALPGLRRARRRPARPVRRLPRRAALEPRRLPALRAAAARPAPTARAACASPPPFSHAHAAFRYEFPVDRLLPRLKFHGDLAAGALLATLLHWSLDPAAAAAGAWCRCRCTAPACASAATTRRWSWRGRWRARPGCRCWPSRLRRRRRTRAQTELGAAARRRNVLGAFALAPGPPLPAHVALVDDVLTTGATAGECAQRAARGRRGAGRPVGGRERAGFDGSAGALCAAPGRARCRGTPPARPTGWRGRRGSSRRGQRVRAIDELPDDEAGGHRRARDVVVHAEVRRACRAAPSPPGSRRRGCPARRDPVAEQDRGRLRAGAQVVLAIDHRVPGVVAGGPQQVAEEQQPGQLGGTVPCTAANAIGMPQPKARPR